MHSPPTYTSMLYFLFMFCFLISLRPSKRVKLISWPTLCYFSFSSYWWPSWIRKMFYFLPGIKGGCVVVLGWSMPYILSSCFYPPFHLLLEDNFLFSLGISLRRAWEHGEKVSLSSGVAERLLSSSDCSSTETTASISKWPGTGVCVCVGACVSTVFCQMCASWVKGWGLEVSGSWALLEWDTKE